MVLFNNARDLACSFYYLESEELGPSKPAAEAVIGPKDPRHDGEESVADLFCLGQAGCLVLLDEQIGQEDFALKRIRVGVAEGASMSMECVPPKYRRFIQFTTES